MCIPAPTSTAPFWKGLAYALREGEERTEKRSKVKINELRIAGGGSQSDGRHAAHRGYLRPAYRTPACL